MLAIFQAPECKVAEQLGLTPALLNSASLASSKVEGERVGTSRNAQRFWLAVLIGQVLTEVGYCRRGAGGSYYSLLVPR